MTARFAFRAAIARSAATLGAIGAIFVVALAGCGSAYSSTEAPTAPQAPAPSTTASSIADLAPASSASASSGGKKPRDKTPPRTIVARHVLVQWMGCRGADGHIVRTREQAKTVIDEAMSKLNAGVPFTRVVADYSDEPNSASRGGSLGRFGRGVMDPIFENAAFALAPGERSGIVESSFGFHIIERLE